ncbi:MAG: biotin carboxylase N-terminal domain-containing protein [Pseudomonadota bacterium]
MITKLLIANRGEIAVRIAATARRLGIATVAVFSEADRNAAHAAAADEAVAIGAAPAALSYLRAEALLEAARTTGADAVHPGYGFLSENPEFAEAVAAAGLAWVGPPASAIRAMGLKDAAKALMEEAGVPVVPGYHGAEQDAGFLADEAARIGYPVLIKARAGGGGKGMRLVETSDAFAEALARAQSEAAAAFGDGRVLVERFIANPRHIEVQVFGDAEGRVLHLYERDCSAQRRHQKVIEEAPAPGMTAPLRSAMTNAAVRAAEAVGYRGAGTVEFIVDGAAMAAGAADCFFFMEMNTRLQVEHPVTEAVTGVDLVAWQLLTAAGRPLGVAQSDIALTGHAVEARLYAEDPARDFMPQTGRIETLAFGEGPGVRIDAGVRAGDTVSPHYDPMIAKIIAHGPDRAAAFARLDRALAGTAVDGLVNNLDFLARLAALPDMRAGRLDTGIIAREGAALHGVIEPELADLALAAAALTGMLDAPGPLEGWRAWGPARSHLRLLIGETAHDIAIGRQGGALVAETALGALRFTLTPAVSGPPQYRVTIGETSETVSIHFAAEHMQVTLARPGRRLVLQREDPRARAAAAQAGGGAGDTVAAPLPGLVKEIAVAPGDAVDEGAVLAVMEAMKMEHTLRAPRDGVVASVPASAGEQVAEGALLIALEPEA